MDIHHSEKYGPFARLYFFSAILIVVLGTAFILRSTNFFQQTKDTESTPATVATTNVEEPTIDLKAEISNLSSTSGSIEKKLVAAKQLSWLEAKPVYTEQITSFKTAYTSISNIINFAKNKNKNTTEIEKNFDDLKLNITSTESALTIAQTEDVQKHLDLSLTNLNTIISLVGNI